MSATAALLIIGNEILSARTVDKNLPVLSRLLAARGARLLECRVVRDDAAAIGDALNALRAAYDYVFTSGGVGPTHDDITTASVAAALGLPVVEHPDALARLKSLYDSQGRPLTAPRRRMAEAPQGAEMIAHDHASPMGYRIHNIFVCAGVPAIFLAMAQAACAHIAAAPVAVYRALVAEAPESEVADILTQIQNRRPEVEVGSYPRLQGQKPVCRFSFTGRDPQAVSASLDELADFLRRHNIPHHEWEEEVLADGKS